MRKSQSTDRFDSSLNPGPFTAKKFGQDSNIGGWHHSSTRLSHWYYYVENAFSSSNNASKYLIIYSHELLPTLVGINSISNLWILLDIIPLFECHKYLGTSNLQTYLSTNPYTTYLHTTYLHTTYLHTYIRTYAEPFTLQVCIIETQ